MSRECDVCGQEAAQRATADIFHGRKLVENPGGEALEDDAWSASCQVRLWLKLALSVQEKHQR